MPVYEYECDKCEKVFEVQQRMSDAPLEKCPECDAPVRKLVSMSSFQLKGGGWYSDGYSSPAKGSGSGKTEPASSSSKGKPAPPACQTGAACSDCPAAATG
jgi:putative FmdB family regulatory protein